MESHFRFLLDHATGRSLGPALPEANATTPYSSPMPPKYPTLYFFMALHLIGFVGLLISVGFWSRYVITLRREKRKATNGDKLVIVWMFSMIFNEMAYIFPFLANNFNREKMMLDGKIGGTPNTLCIVQAAMVNYFSASLCVYTTCVLVNVFLTVYAQAKASTLELAFKLYHVWACVIPLVGTIVMFAKADIGPLSMWCWVPCPEIMSDGLVHREGVNNGQCWLRMASLYWVLGTHGVGGIYLSSKLVYMLYEHVKKMTAGAKKKSGTGSGSAKTGNTGNDGVKAKRGFHKTVIFLSAYCYVIFGASAMRFLDVVAPAPQREGKPELTEFVVATISIIMTFIFGMEKWYNPFKGEDGAMFGALSSTKKGSEKSGASTSSTHSTSSKKRRESTHSKMAKDDSSISSIWKEDDHSASTREVKPGGGPDVDDIPDPAGDAEVEAGKSPKGSTVTL